MSSTTSMPPPGTSHRAEHIRPTDIAVGVIVGRVGEFFDFFVFGIAAVLVFPALFFPFVDLETGLRYSFILFAFGFLARLPGALVFRIIHDRYGRTAKLTSALFLLGCSTVGIGLLPSYDDIGASAIVLLATLRITQGIAVGGAWDGLPSLLALRAPPERRGRYAMVAQLGAPLGFIVATGLFAYLYNSTSEADFLDWGWRFAFFCAFAINVVTLFARLRMAVTPEFEELSEAVELKPSPIGELIRNNSSNIALGAMVPLASYALFHLITIFPITWIILFPEQYDLASIFLDQILGGFVCIGTMLISGAVADRIGRVNTLFWGAIGIGLFCLPAPFLGDTVFGGYAFILMGFALLGFSLAQAAGAINTSFESRYRYSGALVTNELSWTLGAGFAPLAALELARLMGNPGVAIYLASGVVVSLLALRSNRVRMLRNEKM